MLLDPSACYQALLTHDHRFDGRFFVGVTSTGIYCRPVCTVKTPKAANCRFFPSAAAAEACGFRPCLRCRPELAPGLASVDAPARLARLAANHIEDGSLNDDSLATLAERMGVTDRHLRRVFLAEFGVSPIAYAQTQRLLLAKRLLTDTALPVTDVALAAGFGSIRRFNKLFVERYRLNPSQFRRSIDTSQAVDSLRFELGYRPPYATAQMFAFLAARAIPGVEQGEADGYRRTVRLERGGHLLTGWLSVKAATQRPVLEVQLSASLAGAIPLLLGRVKRLFDLACQPDEVAAALGPLAEPRPGLRLPGAFDGFEMAVRAILGQQVTVKAAHTLAGRFASRFGSAIATPWPALAAVFPTAAEVAVASESDIASLGIVGARARAILALARAVADGQLALLPHADVERTLTALTALPGIGDWTAHYIAMRALSWPDAFLPGDVAVRKAMGGMAPREMLAQAEAWRPWRAYAVMHLWASLATADGADTADR